MNKFNKGDNIKPIDKCLGESRTICDVCDGYYITNKGILNFEFEDNWEVDEADWLKELKDMPLEKAIEKYVDTPDNQGNPDLRKELTECAHYFANWQRQQIVKDNLLLPFKEYDNLMYSINEKKKEGYKDGYEAGLNDAIEAFKKTLLGQVEVKVIPTNFKETEFCLGDYDDIAMTTQYVKDGRLKMGDKVKILFIKTEDA